MNILTYTVMKLLLLEVWMDSIGGLNSLSTNVSENDTRPTEINRYLCLVLTLKCFCLGHFIYKIQKCFFPLPREILSTIKFMGFINDLEFLVCHKSALYKCKYSVKKCSTMWICLFSVFTVTTSLHKMKLNPRFPYNVCLEFFKTNAFANSL